MRKSIGKKCFSFFIVIFMVLGMGFSHAGTVYEKADKGRIIAKHDFSDDASNRDNLYYEPEKEITYEGVKYKLVSREYKVKEILQPVTYYVTVKTKNKNSLKDTVTRVIKGKKYTLKASTPKWKERKTDLLQVNREYDNRNSVPDTLSYRGKILELKGIKKGSKTQNYVTPLKFYSETKDTNLYRFNGKMVTLKNGQPIWTGYDKDIKAHLGENGANYRINSVSWQGGFIRNGNGFVRTANVSGSKRIHMTVATYTNQNAVDVTYTAKVKYVDSQYPSGELKATCIATYEKQGFTTVQKILVGVGIVVIAFAISFILMKLRKKKQNG